MSWLLSLSLSLSLSLFFYHKFGVFHIMVVPLRLVPIECGVIVDPVLDVNVRKKETIVVISYD